MAGGLTPYLTPADGAGTHIEAAAREALTGPQFRLGSGHSTTSCG